MYDVWDVRLLYSMMYSCVGCMGCGCVWAMYGLCMGYGVQVSRMTYLDVSSVRTPADTGPPELRNSQATVVLSSVQVHDHYENIRHGLL